jgi:NAD(P)-dependent dehydrogenase (short-subunit alcohol dehydrogenase family)
MMQNRTIVVTGSSSGMGAATRSLLSAQGDRVIGVDLHDADVVADLGTVDGRASAIEEVEGLSGGVIDGLVTWAGLGGFPDRVGSLLASVNYFGTVTLLAGLRPLLAKGTNPAAIAIGSNSMTCQPGVPMDVVRLCLEGDEQAARDAADAASSIMTYPATKLALTRWVRHHAPSADWAGAGITLNVVAPGVVETPLLQATRDDPLLGPFLEAFPVPIGRNGTAEELAGVISFLLGESARFFCGSVLVVDGGTESSLRADDLPSPLG